MGWREITADEAASVAQNAEHLGGYGWEYNQPGGGYWQAGHTYQQPDGSRVTIERRRPKGWDGRSDGPETILLWVDDRAD